MNPTHAKEIALYFLDLTQDKYTPNIVARTVIQAKALLSAGYTKVEIIQVIDAVLKKKPDVYSLGYVSSSINDILREIKEKETSVLAEKQREKLRTQIAETIESNRSEVTRVDESTERNREKARRASAQSRFGKKFDFDMFEE
jgi:Holliday junction resolvasome RuvABC DNA-binding subunit